MGRVRLGLCLAAVLATSCGGGGGGSSSGDTATLPRAALAITADNAPLVSAVILDGSDTVSGVGDQAPNLGLVSLASTASNDAAPTPAAFAMNQALRAPVYASMLTSGLRLTEVVSETAACDISGTIKVTLDTASGTLDDFLLGIIAPGASMTLVFNRCNDTSIGTLIDGGFKMTFTQLVGTPGEIGIDLFLMQLDTVFSDLVITGQGGVDGDMSLLTDSDGGGVYVIEIVGARLEVTDVTRTVALFNYFQTVSSDGGADVATDFDFQVDDSLLAGSMIAVSLETFLINTGDSYPYKGKALITGSGGRSVAVTALDNTNVVLDIDSNGDTVVDTTLNKTWQELDDLVVNAF